VSDERKSSKLTGVRLRSPDLRERTEKSKMPSGLVTKAARTSETP
jgi:hypothetical protein